MSKTLNILKTKNSKDLKNTLKLNDTVVIKKVSSEFKNNMSTITGTCVKIQNSNNGTRITLKTFLYNEVIYQSFLLNSPSIHKLYTI